MISILHEKINNIVPIHGVSDNGDESYTIDYINLPNEEQINQINQILSSWPLEKLRLDKLEKIDQEWKTTLSEGWTTPYGWKLGIDTSDVTLLTGAFILAKESNSLGLNIPASIIDTNGISHSLSLIELTSLMLQYGQYRSAISSSYSLKQQAIKNVTSIEELNNI